MFKTKPRRLRHLLFFSILLNVMAGGYLLYKFYIHYFDKHAVGTTLPDNDAVRQYFIQKNEDYSKFQPKQGDIIFAGNSLIEHFNLAEEFTPIKNRGISGDHSGHLLERLPSLTKAKPKKLFIEIGINDILYWNFGKDSLIKNYERLISFLKSLQPFTAVYIHSILPVAENNKLIPSYSFRNKDITLVNQTIKMMCQQHGITYIDLYPFFALHGEMNSQYSSDGIHLNDKGYALWANIITPYVDN